MLPFTLASFWTGGFWVYSSPHLLHFSCLLVLRCCLLGRLPLLCCGPWLLAARVPFVTVGGSVADTLNPPHTHTHNALPSQHFLCGWFGRGGEGVFFH